MTCNSIDHYACKDNRQCLPWAKVCDGKPDCTDRDDESDDHCNANGMFKLPVLHHYGNKDTKIKIHFCNELSANLNFSTKLLEIPLL